MSMDARQRPAEPGRSRLDVRLAEDGVHIATLDEGAGAGVRLTLESTDLSGGRDRALATALASVGDEGEDRPTGDTVPVSPLRPTRQATTRVEWTATAELT